MTQKFTLEGKLKGSTDADPDPMIDQSHGTHYFLLRDRRILWGKRRKVYCVLSIYSFLSYMKFYIYVYNFHTAQSFRSNSLRIPRSGPCNSIP